MRVLVACEYSGVVRDAFTARGHEAMSCDLLPSVSAGPHHRGDVLLDGILAKPWDLLIAHPPCTYLTNSGVRWLYAKPGVFDLDRWTKMMQARDFFMSFWAAQHIPRICIENPVPHGHAALPPYTQTIQPYQFGHPESKRTCLWLKGLPPLQPTNVLTKEPGTPWKNQTPSGQNKYGPSADRWKLRSTTYTGIAQAMAEQWG
jgi:hypothetical protein